MQSILRELVWVALGAGGSIFLLGMAGFFWPGLRGIRGGDGARAVSWATAGITLGLSVGAWVSLGLKWGVEGFGFLLGTGVAAAAGRIGLKLERRRLERGLSGTPRRAVWLRIVGFFLATSALAVALGARGSPRWAAASWIGGLAAFCSVFALIRRQGAGEGEAVALRLTCFGSAGVALLALAWGIVRRWGGEPRLLEGAGALVAGAAWADLLLALGAWMAGARADRAPDRGLWGAVALSWSVVGGLSGLVGLGVWALL